MKSLDELRELERQAAREWLDSLDDLNDMASIHADDPANGCLESFRAAQIRSQQAGLRRLELQIQIAELERADADQRLNFSTDPTARIGTLSQPEN